MRLEVRGYPGLHPRELAPAVQALIEPGLLEKDGRGGLRAPFDEIVIRAGLRKAA